MRYGSRKRRAVEPADFLFALGDEPAAIVDQPIHEEHLGALHRDLAHIDRRRVVGTEHGRGDAGARAIGRHRRAGIAVGRHRHVADAEFLRHRHSEHQPARLERPGRQPSFVLDDQLAALGQPPGNARQRHQRASRPPRATARFRAAAPATVRDTATEPAAARRAPRAAAPDAPHRDHSAPAAAARRATAHAAGRPHSVRRSCCIRDASQKSADRRRSRDSPPIVSPAVWDGCSNHRPEFGKFNAALRLIAPGARSAYAVPVPSARASSARLPNRPRSPA